MLYPKAPQFLFVEFLLLKGVAVFCDEPSQVLASLSRGPRQQGLRGSGPAPNLQPGPEIGPVRADFTHQECAPPPPPPRGGRPRCRPPEGPGKCWRGAPPRPVTTLSGQPPPPDCQGRARGGSHAPPRPSRPPGRQRRGWAGDAELDRGLSPRGQRRPSPALSTRRGAFPVGFPNPFPSRGAARRQRRATEPRIGNESRPYPPAPWRSLLWCPPIPSTPQRGCRRRVAGEQAHLAAAAAAAAGGSTEEGPSDPPRPLSLGGGNGEEGSRQPLSRTPPPQFCLDCCSRERTLQLPFSPPSAPAVSASSSSHSFLPPPPRPAPARRPRAVRHGVTPTGPAAGGFGPQYLLAEVHPTPALERPVCDPDVLERGPRGTGGGPACSSCSQPVGQVSPPVGLPLR